jgi:arabinose-5-phosphate isomerase
LAVAKQTILSESESITKLIDLLDENFADAQEIYPNGRLVVTGIGKALSLHKKMVATFNSTEHHHCFFTHLKLFMGLGMVQKDDIIICISKAETVLK